MQLKVVCELIADLRLKTEEIQHVKMPFHKRFLYVEAYRLITMLLSVTSPLNLRAHPGPRIMADAVAMSKVSTSRTTPLHLYRLSFAH